jgi:hypothetical protein
MNNVYAQVEQQCQDRMVAGDVRPSVRQPVEYGYLS